MSGDSSIVFFKVVFSIVTGFSFLSQAETLQCSDTFKPRAKVTWGDLVNIAQESKDLILSGLLLQNREKFNSPIGNRAFYAFYERLRFEREPSEFSSYGDFLDFMIGQMSSFRTESQLSNLDKILTRSKTWKFPNLDDRDSYYFPTGGLSVDGQVGKILMFSVQTIARNDIAQVQRLMESTANFKTFLVRSMHWKAWYEEGRQYIETGFYPPFSVPRNFDMSLESLEKVSTAKIALSLKYLASELSRKIKKNKSSTPTEEMNELYAQFYRELSVYSLRPVVTAAERIEMKDFLTSALGSNSLKYFFKDFPADLGALEALIHIKLIFSHPDSDQKSKLNKFMQKFLHGSAPEDDAFLIQRGGQIEP